MAVESGQPSTGSADRQGALWSERAQDWADVQEPTARQLYTVLIDVLSPLDGRRVLDIGCGSGLFCALAAEADAVVHGIDAAAALIAIARERVPGGAFDVGEMQQLPYGDGTFDVVTALNAFHYAADPAGALTEAARVTKPGGTLVVGTWDASAASQAAVYLRVLAELAPPPPPGAEQPLGALALSEDGVVEQLAAQAGIQLGPWRSVDASFIYPDGETALRGLLSAGPARAAVMHSGEEQVRDAVAEAIAGFRNVFDGYRMENRFRYACASIGSD